MSLTRRLKDPESAVSRWVDTNFDLSEIVRLVMPQVQDLKSMMPEGDLFNYPWATVGNAVELRMRQGCEIDYYATSAAMAMGGEPQVLHDALAVLWDKYKDDTWTRVEDAWVVYFAGVLEGIYRSGNADESGSYGPTWDVIEAKGCYPRLAGTHDAAPY